MWPGCGLGVPLGAGLGAGWGRAWVRAGCGLGCGLGVGSGAGWVRAWAREIFEVQKKSRPKYSYKIKNNLFLKARLKTFLEYVWKKWNLVDVFENFFGNCCDNFF